MSDREPKLEAALQQILVWADAYPKEMFPPPDEKYLKDAHRVLEESGMSLDRISAYCMRHTLNRVAEIAAEALEVTFDLNECAGRPQVTYTTDPATGAPVLDGEPPPPPPPTPVV